MRKVYLLFFLFTTLFISGQESESFTLEVQEIPEKAAGIQETLGEESLFVFETSLDLQFSHSYYLDSDLRTVKNGSFIYLYIPSDVPSGSITIKANGSEGYISYGQKEAGEEESLSRLEAGDIRYFKVVKKRWLKWFIDKNNNINKKDLKYHGAAIIHLQVKPENIEFTIKPEDFIIEVDKTNSSEGKYKVYLKSGEDHSLTIIKNGYVDTKIEVKAMTAYENIFININDPSKEDEIVLGGFYLNSNPEGALIQILGLDSFTEKKERTPYYFSNFLAGNYRVTLIKAGYDTTTVTIAIGSNRKKTIELKERIGYLNIPAKENSHGASVWVDNKEIGKIPIQHYELVEGEHKVIIRKDKFVSDNYFYPIQIEKNKNFTFNQYQLLGKKVITINTTPVTKATIYINNRRINKKTNFKIELPVGSHNIMVLKEGYRELDTIIVINEKSNAVLLPLKKKDFAVSISSKPSSSHITIDGKYIGTTPLNTHLSLGKHKLELRRKGVISEKRTYSIKKDRNIQIKAFPSSFYMFGMRFGKHHYTFQGGFTLSRLYFGGNFTLNNNSDGMKSKDLSVHRIQLNDIDTYGEEYGRIYDTANSTVNFGIKVGYLFRMPFPFIWSVGFSSMNTDPYYKVHKAHSDYVDQFNHIVLQEGEYFSEDKTNSKKYTALTTSLIIPIFSALYISGEYYTNSDFGQGFTFGLGFKLNYLYSDRTPQRNPYRRRTTHHVRPQKRTPTYVPSNIRYKKRGG